MLTHENQIQIVKGLETDVIRIWPGYKNYLELNKNEYEHIIKDIKLFADKAKAENISIVLERHSNTITNGWDNIPDILSDINKSNVYLNYQIVFPDLKENIIAKANSDYNNLLPLSIHAHLQNYSKTDFPKRSFLDNGIIDYTGLREAISLANYNGYFMIEFLPGIREDLNDFDTVKREIDFIKSL